ncbi:Zinc finger protein 90 [Anthophora quadrimaculata]
MSLLAEGVDLLSMRQTLSMAWFPEESHPGGMWQGADIQVSDMRQKVQTQAPLAITREMHAPSSLKKLWWCFQCGKQYMWRDSLKKHLRIECGKDPTFECPICGRKFKHKHRFQSHARLIHYLNVAKRIGRMPRLTVKNIENLRYKRRPVIHKCTRCGKGYQLETSLRRHQRLECGVEPRQSCQICGKKFTHRFKLTHHLASCRRKREYYETI